MAADRKSCAGGQFASPEDQSSYVTAAGSEQQSASFRSHPEQIGESASTAGKPMRSGGTGGGGAKASPPRLVRREKKASVGCADKNEDATGGGGGGGGGSRSDYIQLPQLERMLESERLEKNSAKDSRSEIVPPKRIHDSPKRREAVERRVIPPPQTESIDPLNTLRPQNTEEVPVGHVRSSASTAGTAETKYTYTDSGYSTLEETLARFDKERLLPQRATPVGPEIPETSSRGTAKWPPVVSAATFSSFDKKFRQISSDSGDKDSSKKIDSKNEEREKIRAKSEDAERSRCFERASSIRRGSVDGDDVTGCTAAAAAAKEDAKIGYAPVKTRDERPPPPPPPTPPQDRSKLLDSSKLEDIRLLSTAILEYLQSRNNDDHVTDELLLKDESNYTIFKNADHPGAPYLPQKKHRVLPSPVKVGQALRTVGGGTAVEAGGMGFHHHHHHHRQMEADEMVEASTLGPHLSEPTHMNWEEVLREAKMLGIPLSRSSSRCRSTSDRRSSMSSSAASSDISHHSSPCSSPIRGATKRKTAKEDASAKDQKSGQPTNKLGIFNLQGWLSKLRRSPKDTTAAAATATGTKRRQHLSCSSDRHTAVSAALTAQVQRRSLSASATQRNRINLGTDRCTCDPRVGEAVSSSFSNRSPSYRPTSSLTYDISASGSRGSSNSFLSMSMIASPSTSSLGSVFSRSSRGSSGNPLMLSASSRDHGIGLHSSSPLSSSASPMSPSCGGGGGGGVGGGGQQRTPATLGISQAYSRRTSKSPTRNSRNLDLMKTIDQLKDCGWYWGSLGWEEARMKLDSAPDGAFLLRDSSDDRYLFSLSFRSQGKVHHTRIEHYKGTFNFTSQSSFLSSTSIVELIERAMIYSQTHPYVSCLQPRPPGLNPIPIQLLYPVTRSVVLPSLQQLCRATIVRSVRIEDIDRLPITDRLKNYIRISQQV